MIRDFGGQMAAKYSIAGAKANESSTDLNSIKDNLRGINKENNAVHNNTCCWSNWLGIRTDKTTNNYVLDEIVSNILDARL